MRLRSIESGLAIAGPVLIAIGAVLSRFAESATTVESLSRPVVVSAGVAVGLYLLANLAVRNRAWATILSSGLVLFTFRFVLPAFAILAFSMWWLVIRELRRRQQKAVPSPVLPGFIARGIGVFGAAFLVLMASAAVGVAVGVPRMSVPEYPVQGDGGPNIYMIMLDGYPRDDTLLETFGVDNSGFLNDLQRLGLDLSSSARGNYNKTWPAFAAMFNGTYAHEMLPDGDVPSQPSDQLRWLHRLIREGAMLEVLGERGYATRAITSPFQSTALSTADDVRSGGFLNEFEANLIASSSWTYFLRDPVTSLLRSNQRNQVEFALLETAAIAEQRGSQPQFVFAHVHSPHTPFVLPAGDQDPNSPECFPRSCSFWNVTIEELAIDFDSYRTALVPQIRDLNRQVVEAVTRISTADPTAVVVVMSDHGARYSLADIPEHYRTLLAARTPKFPNLFSDSESPVNILRVIFEAYFDLNTPALPYEAWASEWRSYLPLRQLELTEEGEP